jgi:cell wall-associated NlpC family hydrolase
MHDNQLRGFCEACMVRGPVLPICEETGMPAALRPLIVAFTLATAVLSAACASSGAVPRPFPVPGSGEPAPASPTSSGGAGAVTVPDEDLPPMGDGEAFAVASTALSLRGAPYRNGGTTPDGFDCSGFVQYVYRLHGVAVPRETREQFRQGRSLGRDDLSPGDLVFFTTVAPGASHVGIVIGPDQFVHAPSERGVVRVERLSSEYWNRRYVGARRPR